MKLSKRLLILVSLAAVGVTLAAVGSAGAARSQSVQCKGTADYCGATVSIAGGVKNRVVTVMLTDTNLSLRGVWAAPSSASGAYKITKASFRLGGSQYRFTLNARPGAPRRSRIVLLFGAGSRGAGIGGLKGHWELSHAIFSVGAGKTVSIIGGGGGTSLCTRDETVSTFTTKGNDESHDFAIFAKDDGSCYTDLSWSQFRVTIKNSAGQLVGSGIMFLGQRYVFGDYITSCGYGPWVGASCTQSNPDPDTFSDLKISQ